MKQQDTQEITLHVHQRPVSVNFECPACMADIEIDYDKFVSDHGDPPDWDYADMTCPCCGYPLKIDDIDWG